MIKKMGKENFVLRKKNSMSYENKEPWLIKSRLNILIHII
jgi:hypothetical protein